MVTLALTNYMLLLINFINRLMFLSTIEMLLELLNFFCNLLFC